MNRQELEGCVANLTRDFFRAKLRLQPESLEVLATRNLLLVRVKGFLRQADRAMMKRSSSQRAVEGFYVRVFDQLTPLIQAGIGARGGLDLLDFETLLNFPHDRCVFVWSLRVAEGGGLPAAHESERAEASAYGSA